VIANGEQQLLMDVGMAAVRSAAVPGPLLAAGGAPMRWCSIESVAEFNELISIKLEGTVGDCDWATAQRSVVDGGIRRRALALATACRGVSQCAGAGVSLWQSTSL
jgi:hypothetical protein